MNRRAEPLLSALEPHAELSQVTRETVQDQVYEALRRAVMQGDVKPGENLTIPGLARTFGTSHMPVRQALYRLAAERALTVISGRSVGVPPLSRTRLQDLTRVRSEIEGMAAAWAAERVDGAALEALTPLVEQMWQHSEDEDASGFLVRNQNFHFAVYRAARSDTLLPIIESLWLQIGPYLSLLHRSGNYRDANRHHEQLLQALRRGDAEAARAALVGDITTAAGVLLTLVKEG